MTVLTWELENVWKENQTAKSNKIKTWRKNNYPENMNNAVCTFGDWNESEWFHKELPEYTWWCHVSHGTPQEPLPGPRNWGRLPSSVTVAPRGTCSAQWLLGPHPQAWLGYLATKPSFLSSKDLLKDLSKPQTRGVKMRKVVRIQDPSITTSLVKQNLKSTPADKAFKWMLRLVVVRNQEGGSLFTESWDQNYGNAHVSSWPGWAFSRGTIR